MTDPTDDIDALRFFLEKVGEGDPMRCDPEDACPWSRALTALVAERDELKEKAKMLDTVIGERNEYEAITNELRIQLDAARSFWRDRAERRDAEQKSAADRDLRERLVCAALTGLCSDPSVDMDESGSRAAVAIADRTLAAMRKGGGA